MCAFAIRADEAYRVRAGTNARTAGKLKVADVVAGGRKVIVHIVYKLEIYAMPCRCYVLISCHASVRTMPSTI